MSVYVDTSAWFAVASEKDRRHDDARSTITELVEHAEPLVTCSYALAETMGLVHARLGWSALERVAAGMRVADVVWVDADLHAEAETVLFARRRRRLSIVDAAGIAVMRAPCAHSGLRVR